MTPNNEVGKRLGYGFDILGIVIRIPRNAEFKNEEAITPLPHMLFPVYRDNCTFILLRFKGLNVFFYYTHIYDCLPASNFP
jgi:hypothetical protein